jgi:hypothetical protein
MSGFFESLTPEQRERVLSYAGPENHGDETWTVGAFANLRWAVIANDENHCGLFGPTVLREGPLPECEPLVRAGLLRFVNDGRAEQRGYWITDAGRVHLAGTRLGESN